VAGVLFTFAEAVGDFSDRDSLTFVGEEPPRSFDRLIAAISAAFDRRWADVPEQIRTLSGDLSSVARFQFYLCSACCHAERYEPLSVPPSGTRRNCRNERVLALVVFHLFINCIGGGTSAG